MNYILIKALLQEVSAMFPKDNIPRQLHLGQSWKENADEKYCSIRCK